MSVIVFTEKALFRGLGRDDIRLRPLPRQRGQEGRRGGGGGRGACCGGGVGDEVPLPHAPHDGVEEKVGVVLQIPEVVDAPEHLVLQLEAEVGWQLLRVIRDALVLPAAVHLHFDGSGQELVHPLLVPHLGDPLGVDEEHRPHHLFDALLAEEGVVAWRPPDIPIDYFHELVVREELVPRRVGVLTEGVVDGRVHVPVAPLVDEVGGLVHLVLVTLLRHHVLPPLGVRREVPEDQRPEHVAVRIPGLSKVAEVSQ